MAVLIGIIAVLALGLVVSVVGRSDDDDDGRLTLDDPELDDEGVFVDPQDRYSIELGPDWAQGPEAITGAESFIVAEPSDGFTPNVNVITAMDAPGGMDLSDYVELAADGIEQLYQDAEVLDSGVVEGTQGRELGYVEYTAAIGGPGGLHFLALVDVAGGGSASATLTAQPDRFDEVRAEVEPYLRTLQLLDT